MATMEELAFRFRRADPEDAKVLRHAQKSTLSHPEGQSRSETFRGAIDRGELLLLERYDSRTKSWMAGGYIDYHMRVDDTLTIRDIGTLGEATHAGIVRHLLDELLRSAAPSTAGLKVRRDAEAWNAILAGTPGFGLAGTEYRRPHWYNVWEWSRERARLDTGRGGRWRRWR
jgi:ribosomal protein S18 acetylase RimI-like enzyme